MALYYELQVFKDVYTLVQKVFLYTQEFPREYKYTLGQDMKRDSIQLVRSIYRANKAKDKVVYLETFLDDFELPHLAQVSELVPNVSASLLHHFINPHLAQVS